MSEKIKEFFASKIAKRAYWTILNTLMSLIVSFIAYLATDNITWAITVLPITQAISQFLTKYINS